MTVTISYPDSLFQRAVSQQPCIASRFFINLSKKALVPVLTLLPCTVQSWPDTHFSDHGRDWPGRHFCSPTLSDWSQVPSLLIPGVLPAPVPYWTLASSPLHLQSQRNTFSNFCHWQSLGYNLARRVSLGGRTSSSSV